MAVTPAEVLAILVVILVAAFFLHLAAGLLANDPRFLHSVLVAVLGSLLAGFVVELIPNALGVILALVAFLAVAAAIYRIGFFRALLLGLLAYVLFVATRWVVLWVAGLIGQGA